MSDPRRNVLRGQQLPTRIGGVLLAPPPAPTTTLLTPPAPHPEWEASEAQQSAPLPPLGLASPEALAVWRLEHALLRSGSAAAVAEACKLHLTEGVVFSWPLARVVGRAAVARHFSLLQLLFVDDADIDVVGVGAADASSTLWLDPALGHDAYFSAFSARGAGGRRRCVALARLTHRLTPRALDALSPPRLPPTEPPPGVVGGAFPAEYPPTAHWLRPSDLPPSSPLLPSLRPLASWLRARLTFKVVDNALYVFEEEQQQQPQQQRPLQGGGGAPPPVSRPLPFAAAEARPKIALIRAEISLLSLIYCLPFGEAAWHGAVEPAMGAAAQVLGAAWSSLVEPWLVPLARARFGGYCAETLQRL